MCRLQPPEIIALVSNIDVRADYKADQQLTLRLFLQLIVVVLELIGREYGVSRGIVK